MFLFEVCRQINILLLLLFKGSVQPASLKDQSTQYDLDTARLPIVDWLSDYY